MRNYILKLINKIVKRPKTDKKDQNAEKNPEEAESDSTYFTPPATGA